MAEWTVGAARDLPIDTEQPWDAARAKSSVFEWAGWPDNPDPAKARRAFLIYDKSAPELKGSYKLPFAEYDQRLEANAGGLHAAASRLPQTDAPQDVLDEARKVLDGYFEQLNRGQATVTVSGAALQFPAQVRAVARGSGDDLLAAAQQRALDPNIFDDHPPFFWTAQISNTQLDAYYTRMAKSTLQNYAADASAGVAFQDSHRTDELARTLGYSLAGRYVGPGGNGVARVEADFYTLTGLPGQDGERIAGFVGKVRAGLARDVSVGFYGGQFRCSICGRDMLTDWECLHLPGFSYEVPDGADGQTRQVLATADIEDAHLAEVSAVYDGATPDASVLGIKARSLADAGQLRPETTQLLAARYRMRLPHAARVYQLGTPPTAEEDRMTTQDTPPTGAQPTADDAPARLRGLLGAAGITVTPEADPFERVRALVEEVQRLRPFEEEVQRLRPLADDGRTYRGDLIDETLREGVRAFGQEFPQETQRGLLEHAPLDAIKATRSMWSKLASERIPGGRLTRDDAEEGKAPVSPASRIPNQAYRG